MEKAVSSGIRLPLLAFLPFNGDPPLNGGFDKGEV
jgi:hypothetical protein